MPTPTIQLTILSKSYPIPDLTRIFNGIKSFNFNSKELDILYGRYKTQAKQIKSFIDAAGLSGTTTLTGSLEQFSNLLQTADINTELGLEAFRTSLASINSQFGSSLFFDAFNTNEWVIETTSPTGGLTQVPLSNVINNIENAEINIAAISPAIASIENSLEAMGGIAAVVGAAVGAADVFGELGKLIENALFGKPPTLQKYISYKSPFGTAITTTPKTGFMKLMDDFKKSDVDNWTNQYVLIAAQLGIRDFTSVVKEFYGGSTSLGNLYSVIESIKSIDVGDATFTGTFPGINSLLTKFEKLYDELIDQLDPIFNEMVRIDAMPWIKTKGVLETQQHSAFRGGLSDPSVTPVQLYWEGKSNVNLWQQMEFLADWMDKVYALIDRINVVSNALNSLYIHVLAAWTSWQDFETILPIVIAPTLPGLKSPPDEVVGGVIGSPVLPVPKVDLAELLGSIKKTLAPSISIAKTITVTKTKEEEEKKKKRRKKRRKKKKVKKRRKNKSPRGMIIESIGTNYNKNIVIFVFDTSSNMNSNSKGTITFISRVGRTTQFKNVNRGAYSYATINRFNLIKLKGVRKISRSSQLKAITEELRHRESYDYQ